jgi:hypothetical protein
MEVKKTVCAVDATDSRSCQIAEFRTSDDKLCYN